MRKSPKKIEKPEYPIIKKIFPRFRWIECDYCGCKFKKEYGWEIWRKSVFANIESERVYSCMECNPKEESIIKKMQPKPYKNHHLARGVVTIAAKELPPKRPGKALEIDD